MYIVDQILQISEQLVMAKKNMDHQMDLLIYEVVLELNAAGFIPWGSY